MVEARRRLRGQLTSDLLSMPHNNLLEGAIVFVEFIKVCSFCRSATITGKTYNYSMMKKHAQGIIINYVKTCPKYMPLQPVSLCLLSYNSLKNCIPCPCIWLLPCTACSGRHLALVGLTSKL